MQQSLENGVAQCVKIFQAVVTQAWHRFSPAMCKTNVSFLGHFRTLKAYKERSERGVGKQQNFTKCKMPKTTFTGCQGARCGNSSETSSHHLCLSGPGAGRAELSLVALPGVPGVTHQLPLLGWESRRRCQILRGV